MNWVTSDNVDKDNYLSMSNSGTYVFISLLSLAGSQIVQRENDIRLITCIASCDQTRNGFGCVSFDIAELPFSEDSKAFEKDKAFLINSAKRVISQKDWHNLGYKPDVERANYNQNEFIQLLTSFNHNHRQPFEQNDFYLAEKVCGDKCKKHGVYLHELGCVVCNDDE